MTIYNHNTLLITKLLSFYVFYSQVLLWLLTALLFYLFFLISSTYLLLLKTFEALNADVLLSNYNIVVIGYELHAAVVSTSKRLSQWYDWCGSRLGPTSQESVSAIPTQPLTASTSKVRVQRLQRGIELGHCIMARFNY